MWFMKCNRTYCLLGICHSSKVKIPKATRRLGDFGKYEGQLFPDAYRGALTEKYGSQCFCQPNQQGNHHGNGDDKEYEEDRSLQRSLVHFLDDGFVVVDESVD